MRWKIYLVLFSLVICLAFCSKSGRLCANYGTAPVNDVSGATTAGVNQEVDIKVRYYFANSCGKFAGLETKQVGNVIDVTINAAYTGCACLDVLLSGETIYKFRASQAGTYQLNFEQPHNAVLTHTISVN